MTACRARRTADMASVPKTAASTIPSAEGIVRAELEGFRAARCNGPRAACVAVLHGRRGCRDRGPFAPRGPLARPLPPPPSAGSLGSRGGLGPPRLAGATAPPAGGLARFAGGPLPP